MGLLQWLGRGIRLTDGQFWGAWYGGENWAGKAATPGNALNLSAWWRSVRLYGDVTGAMPIKVYERRPNDDRIELPDSDLAGLISTQPNADQTPQEFWSSIASSLAIQGNAYAEQRFIGSRLVALEPLPFETCATRTHNRDGNLEYHYVDRGKEEWLPREKVFHVRGFMLGKSDVGMSPLAAARQALGISLATEEATGKTFAKGMRASGFFSLPAGMKSTPESRADFKKTFIDPMTGNNADVHWGLLEGGIEPKTINISPKDAEMLLSRRFNVEEICRFMGMPPVLVGHSAEGQTMWGTGVESIINMWLTLGYNSFLRYIESAINRWLIASGDRRRIYVEYLRDALLRIDSAARAEFIGKMIQNAQMTPNEGRKTANRLPMAGGDVLLINSTLVPLTEAGRLTRGLPTPDRQVQEPAK